MFLIEIPNEKEKIIYKEAIQSGKEVRKYVRIQVIGKDGVGKTSLVRRLLNQDIEDVKSTDGIEINRICHIKESDGTWIFDNGELHNFYSICKFKLIIQISTCSGFSHYEYSRHKLLSNSSYM